jgi:hypothetical protein
MIPRFFGFRGGGRRRRLILAVVVSVAALGAFLISNALAVHDEAFQLDGDPFASTQTNIGGHTQGVDWDSLFNADGSKKALPTDFNASGFHKDFNTKTQRGSTVFDSFDDTTYATGSKDTLPITGSKPGSGWQCAKSNNVGGKVDIMNAYAAAYTDPTSGHQFLYFGQERYSNNGDANVGFWFLQDGTVACTGGGGATDFTGHHRDGDLFIVSAFTAGGDVSTIDVYVWSGDDSGSLGTTAVAHGADCGSISDPPNPPSSDDACAEVNTVALSGIPWLTANQDDGVGHSLRPAEFFEGGVDLTAHNLAGKCFNTFISNTRSSQSLTATLFDFDVGQLGLCSVSTAQKWYPQDTATVTGGIAGSVTFKLYENGTCTAPAAKTYVDSTAPYETTQSDYPVTATTTISWSATFTPTDTSVAPFSVTRCERSDLTINNSASAFPPSP